MMKLNTRRFSFLAVFLLFSHYMESLNAQHLLQVEFKAALSEFLIENLLNADVDNGVRMYKILYETTGINNQPDTASGLVIIPDLTGEEMPGLIFQHGTVANRDDVPSNLQGGYELALVFAAFGYFSCAPDYLGLGESRGFHAYLHSESEARAAIDMFFAAKQYAETENISLNNQLFITGYSQGGHAALAVHQAIEQRYSGTLEVTVSAPMSGPYDLSDTMVKFTLSETPYEFVAYLAHVALSYHDVYGNLIPGDDLNRFYKPAYTSPIRAFGNDEISIWELNSQLKNVLNQEVGQSIPRYILQDSIYEIIWNGEDHPINDALIDNNLYEWAPQAPTRLIYCMADEQVSYLNSVKADSVMNELGAPDVLSIDVHPLADHGECILPAVTKVLEYFNEYKNTTTSIAEADRELELKIHPNPANERIFLTGDAMKISELFKIRIFDLQGRLIFESEHSGHFPVSIETNQIPAGLYSLLVQSESGQFMSKFIVYH